MKKYIYAMLAIAFLTILTGCSRSDFESCETEYSRVVALTNLVHRFTNDWGILQLWPITWGVAVVGKLRR